MKIAVKPSAIKTPVSENIQQPIVAVKQPTEQPVNPPQPQEGQGLRIRHDDPSQPSSKKQTDNTGANRSKKRRPRNRGKANSNNGSNRPADKHTVNEIRFH